MTSANATLQVKKEGLLPNLPIYNAIHSGLVPKSSSRGPNSLSESETEMAVRELGARRWLSSLTAELFILPNLPTESDKSTPLFTQIAVFYLTSRGKA